MKEYYLVIDKIEKSDLNQNSRDFIDAFDYFYLLFKRKAKPTTKEDKKFVETLEENYWKNKKLQKIIEILQKPFNADDSKMSNLLNHKGLKIIIESIKNEIENFKHFAKINKYSDNFNNISHLVADQIKYDYEFPDLVLINLEKMNNERLVEDFGK